MKILTSAVVLVALVCALASGASALPWDKRTNFTFAQPVALPGSTLPAGTYMFRLANPDAGRNVIQVSNRSGTVNYQLQTVPAYRADTPKDSAISFRETSAGGPAVIDSFWYAGEQRGFQFIYSNERLEALESAVVENPGVPPAKAAARRAAPAEHEALVAQVESPPQAPVPQEPQPGTRERLPGTASPLALLLLGGVASAWFGVKLLRKS